jgi:prepilin-type N-terminal cleavage/methylation domain-containing protein
MHSPRSAFTLIELLVGITIIVILSTAAFVGYSTYTTKSRDATRLHDITTIYSSLSLQIQKSGSMPIPENTVTFVNSGSTIPVGYQGSVGPTILKSIGVDKGGRDPKEQQYYSYIRDKNGTKGQILGFFEEDGK